jgi:hypothetical protein
MKIAVAALGLLTGSVSAFVPSSERKAGSTTSLYGGMDDLKTIAEKSNPVLKVRRRML